MIPPLSSTPPVNQDSPPPSLWKSLVNWMGRAWSSLTRIPQRILDLIDKVRLTSKGTPSPNVKPSPSSTNEPSPLLNRVETTKKEKGDLNPIFKKNSSSAPDIKKTSTANLEKKSIGDSPNLPDPVQQPGNLSNKQKESPPVINPRLSDLLADEDPFHNQSQEQPVPLQAFQEEPAIEKDLKKAQAKSEDHTSLPNEPEAKELLSINLKNDIVI